MTSPSFERLPPPNGTGSEHRPAHVAPGANGAARAHGNAGADASVGELTARLGQQVTRLVRDELALAQLEAKQRAKKVGIGAGLVGTGGLFAFLGACCGVVAAVLALAMVLRPWAATIAVGLALFVLAGLLALPGTKVLLSKRPRLPKDSVESLKADLSAVRGGSANRSGRRGVGAAVTDEAEIKADLELTRAELAETVDALRAKLDVKAQATHRLRAKAARAVQLAHENERTLLIVAGVVATVLLLRSLRRKAD